MFRVAVPAIFLVFTLVQKSQWHVIYLGVRCFNVRYLNIALKRKNLTMHKKHELRTVCIEKMQNINPIELLAPTDANLIRFQITERAFINWITVINKSGNTIENINTVSVNVMIYLLIDFSNSDAYIVFQEMNKIVILFMIFSVWYPFSFSSHDIIQNHEIKDFINLITNARSRLKKKTNNIFKKSNAVLCFKMNFTSLYIYELETTLLIALVTLPRTDILQRPTKSTYWYIKWRIPKPDGKLSVSHDGYSQCMMLLTSLMILY